MNAQQRMSLARWILIAEADTGQSRKVADFLLSWWNAASCGGFDPTDLWAVDAVIARDMICVVQLIADANTYPDTLGYRGVFEGLVRQWRPHLLVNHDP